MIFITVCGTDRHLENAIICKHDTREDAIAFCKKHAIEYINERISEALLVAENPYYQKPALKHVEYLNNIKTSIQDAQLPIKIKPDFIAFMKLF